MTTRSNVICLTISVKISAPSSSRVCIKRTPTYIIYTSTSGPLQVRDLTKLLMAASCSPPIPRLDVTGLSCHSPSAITTVTPSWTAANRLPNSRIESAKSSSAPPKTRHSFTTPSNPSHHPSSAANGSLYPSLFCPPRNAMLHLSPTLSVTRSLLVLFLLLGQSWRKLAQGASRMAARSFAPSSNLNGSISGCGCRRWDSMPTAMLPPAESPPMMMLSGW